MNRSSLTEIASAEFFRQSHLDGGASNRSVENKQKQSTEMKVVAYSVIRIDNKPKTPVCELLRF